MLFNSITFLVFFVLVFFMYWFPLKRNLRGQNIFLLVCSYVFYGWWDWRFLGLIALSTIVDYAVGLALGKTQKVSRRKALLVLSMVFNLGVLCYFKYVNFFIGNLILAFSKFGMHTNMHSLHLILPVGISFYTFQTMSYTIDVYRRKISHTRSFVNFAAFVAFFPQLVAGPIERASHLLPQFSKPRVFDYEKAKSGLFLMVWGLFKKVVIADTCATYVNVIFEDYQNMNSLSLMLGAFYFAFQIYGDFSGYSDMAIGLARLLGFDLMMNFNKPYFSRNIGEFWRRWHISLSTWFRDYLYIPLGGSRGKSIMVIRNVFLIFLISGFWHGANWTFMFWGFLNALYFLPLLYKGKHKTYTGHIVLGMNRRGLRDLGNMILTFALVLIAWVFFRARHMDEALNYLKISVTDLTFNIQYLSIERYAVEALLLIAAFIFIEWRSRHQEHPFTGRFKQVYFSLALCFIIILGVYSQHTDFIYFQF